uniref:NADH-ubiquinone oxidoreductase chain 3 n=1 Tax=Glaucocystis nostochinearum TaxID=38271 RepID=E9P6D1_9EUKA|nr:NADH dehydrogenase subunit 3 [Glaucocystis nostochinearum]ADW83115.1 NADH dehydrogenase subunit 3 [Glaucocystis nostochinearum]
MSIPLLHQQYFVLFIYLSISIILSVVIFGLSYFVASQRADSEKVSAYECGFNPFDDARNTFDIRFYLVSILFIIFDLEVAFLFPWALTLSKTYLLGFWSMIIFLILLTIGFFYEWMKGALEWE